MLKKVGEKNMNNALVPINEIKAEEKALSLYKKQKRKIKLIRFVTLLTLGLLIALIYFNFEKISNFFNKETLDSNADTSTNSSTSSSTDTLDKNPVQVIPSNAYEIIEEGFVFSSITNKTEFELGPIEFNPKKASEIYQNYGKEAPVALIIHSACLEAYSNGLYYTTDDEFYSNSENVRDIGKAMANKLTSLGVNTIHIDNIFANGAIYSSREEYNALLKSTLEKYPSIEYVFDISRDIIINDNLKMTKPVCSVNGTNMAQMKISVGSSTKNELWKSNLSLATMLASQNSDITKEVVLSPFSLSYELCPQFLKLDIGAYSNTYDEALLLANEASIRIASLIS